MEGAVERVRPKMMTVVAIMGGLLPIMWGTGTGSEVMSRIAAPMVGGMISSTVLTLAVNPGDLRAGQAMAPGAGKVIARCAWPARIRRCDPGHKKTPIGAFFCGTRTGRRPVRLAG